MNDKTTCPIRFGWVTDQFHLLLTCELTDGHDDEHEAVWKHGLNDDMPATTVHWLTDDRRSFVGEWSRCPKLQGLCVLPADHPGNHAA